MGKMGSETLGNLVANSIKNWIFLAAETLEKILWLKLLLPKLTVQCRSESPTPGGWLPKGFPHRHGLDSSRPVLITRVVPVSSIPLGLNPAPLAWRSEICPRTWGGLGPQVCFSPGEGIGGGFPKESPP